MSVSSLGFETFPRLLPRVAPHEGFLRHLSTPCGARRNSFATQISPILSESLTVGIHGPVSKTHLKNDSWPLFVKRWDLPQTGRQNLPVSTGPISCLKMVKHYML